MAEIDFDTPPKYVPQVAVLAAQLFAECKLDFDQPSLEKLQEAIDALRDDHNALFWALMGLEGLSQIYARNGQQRGADQLSALLRAQRDRHAEVAAKVVARWRGQSEEEAERLKKSLGAELAKKQAPMFGADAPKGTTKLSDLLPPGGVRPPPKGRR